MLLAAWPRVVRELAGEARLNVVGSSALAPLVRAAVPRERAAASTSPARCRRATCPAGTPPPTSSVSPATRNESFGIVLLEAMASGKAVVCSDLPGYRAVCRPRVEGVLVPPGDAEGSPPRSPPAARRRAAPALAAPGGTAPRAFGWVVGGRARGLLRRGPPRPPAP